MNDILRWRKTVLSKTDDYVIRFSKTLHPVLHLHQMEQQRNGDGLREFHDSRRQATTAQQPMTTEERYVSLRAASSSVVEALPPSLRHIDPRALEGNRPQRAKDQN
jgi:hypothetical protein